MDDFNFDMSKVYKVANYFRDVTDCTGLKFKNINDYLPHKTIFPSDIWNEFENYGLLYDASKINDDRFYKLNDILNGKDD